MNGEQIWGVIRTILSAVSGYFTLRGVVDEATVTAVLGAFGTLFITGWSVWSKRSTATIMNAAALPNVKSVVMTNSADAEAIPVSNVVAPNSPAARG